MLPESTKQDLREMTDLISQMKREALSLQRFFFTESL